MADRFISREIFSWALRALALPLGLVAAPALAQTAPLGANLEQFDYPYPVHWFETRSAGQSVRMAYMDIAPAAAANGRVAVLLHGKNFCAATWGDTAKMLAAHGYRVIVPDQIGFCKSTKPAGYQYSLAALAGLTRDLLRKAGVTQPILVGHSTGGLIAMRYALLFPHELSSLVLVNPLGLNDTVAEGVPYTPLGGLLDEEAKTSAATIKAYQLRYYYHGEWRPAYDRWVAMLAGQYASRDGAVVRDAQARLSDMIETQPVAAEIPRIAVQTTLIIGEADTTAFRASSAPVDMRGRIRTVPQAAQEAVRRFPQARLVPLSGLGHAPQIEAPERFAPALLAALAGRQ
ncbi:MULTISPECIES: alpha/beta hydrolase [unclassified Sphingomonas]|uniref:alpha/beta fold hydrolase n=1 Tax=unclassified Sphingomonas TaxID=196159 RepID=UPI00226A0C8C|nr:MULTISPECIES: alpha/beta hydrolase [unclassified Sphingomonas]